MDTEDRRYSVRLTVTRTLAFRCLCAIAQAPRFWLGALVGVGFWPLVVALLVAVGVL